MQVRLFAGKVVDDSGFVKQEVARAWIDVNGILGDEHGYVHHGGHDRAVLHMPAQHYDHLDPGLDLTPGSLGENLAVTGGPDESMVRIGDIYALGDALLQVAQPRDLCYKVGLRGVDFRALEAAHRVGWFYRVLRQGVVAAGDTLTLAQAADASNPTVAQAATLPPAKHNLRRCAVCPELAQAWKTRFVAPLDGRAAEAAAAPPFWVGLGWKDFAWLVMFVAVVNFIVL